MGTSQDTSVDDVTVRDVWTRLAADPNTVLVDVQIQAEWTDVGLPDLSTLGRKVVLGQWQTYPDNRVDPAFADSVSASLSAAGTSRAAELFFICRSGARSRAAAEAMAAAGYSRCRNVAEGFEGPLDTARQRGGAGGWKVAGLPWAQG